MSHKYNVGVGCDVVLNVAKKPYCYRSLCHFCFVSVSDTFVILFVIFLHLFGMSNSHDQYNIVPFFFDEPTLKDNIVTVSFIMVRFGAFFYYLLCSDEVYPLCRVLFDTDY